MKVWLLCILTCFCFIACNQTVTQKEKKELFEKATYDIVVIKNLSIYNQLKDILVENADTIIKYRNSKNNVLFVGSKGKKDSMAYVNEDCWDFFDGNDRYDITNVPPFIYAQLRAVWNQLGKDGISSFRICKDKGLEIVVRNIANFNINELEVAHVLRWNKGEGQNRNVYELKKDTTIEDKWHYEIGLYEAQGW